LHHSDVDGAVIVFEELALGFLAADCDTAL
jgi:hypothetical protein